VEEGPVLYLQIDDWHNLYSAKVKGTCRRKRWTAIWSIKRREVD